MNSEYELTIGVPTYNRAPLLNSSISRICEQIKGLNDRVEVIVSDNCSTDNTPETLNELAKDYSFKSYRNEKNLGPDGNFLSILNKAKGEFVWIVSDDDNLSEEAIAKVVGLLNSYGDRLSLLYLNVKLVTAQTSNSFLSKEDGWGIFSKDDFAKIVGCNITFLTSLIFRRDNFLNIKNPERFLDTNFFQSYIAMSCPVSGGVSEVGILFTPIVTANSNGRTAYSMYTVFGKRLKALLVYSWSNLGYSKKDLKHSYIKYLKTTVRPGIFMAKAHGFKNMLQHPNDFFKATWMYWKSWFLFYPFMIIPCWVYQIARKIIKKK